MKKFKILFYVLGGVTILFLGWIVIIRLLGFQLNKEFFTFNKQQCIEKEYPTYSGHSGIEGCVFWARNDFLEKKENWWASFIRDDAYCKQVYGNKDDSSVGFATRLNLTFNENNDPKCGYEGVREQKRKENWSYLTSKDKDQFYYSCVEQICPNKSLFK